LKAPAKGIGFVTFYVLRKGQKDDVHFRAFCFLGLSWTFFSDSGRPSKSAFAAIECGEDDESSSYHRSTISTVSFLVTIFYKSPKMGPQLLCAKIRLFAID